MRFCRNCGKELPEGAKVCLGCGVREGDGTKFCPNCGAEPDPLAVICVKCGCELKPLHSKSPRKRSLWLWMLLLALVAGVLAAEAVAKEKAEEAKRTAARTHGTISGHQWVDLGLPSGLKWATCNVGASSPEDYGDYYAWGELSTKDEYTRSNCSTDGKSIRDISSNPNCDVARAKWGGSWRMPTRAEFKELIYNCTCEWTTKGGHNGYKVTGPNGNSIFLPAAGFRDGADTYDAESIGYYWSATPLAIGAQGAYFLYFDSGNRGTFWTYRYYGHSVRPVSD